MNVGRAYAIVRGRMHGNVKKAKELLETPPPARRQEMNRQDSRARGGSKKPYRLGERLRRLRS